MRRSMSDLGLVTAQERLRLLQWIGRCMTVGKGHSFVTPEGVRVTMANPRTQERTILQAEDGELELANYELHFQLTEAAGGWLRPSADTAAVGESDAGGEQRAESVQADLAARGTAGLKAEEEAWLASNPGVELESGMEDKAEGRRAGTIDGRRSIAAVKQTGQAGRTDRRAQTGLYASPAESALDCRGGRAELILYSPRSL